MMMDDLDYASSDEDSDTGDARAHQHTDVVEEEGPAETADDVKLRFVRRGMCEGVASLHARVCSVD